MGSEPRTRVLTSGEDFRERLAGLGPATLLVASAVRDTAFVRGLHGSVAKTVTLERECPIDLEELSRLRDELATSRCVVAVGGGTVMDSAKLAAAVDPHRDGPRLMSGAGAVTLAEPADGPEVVTVPTTVGTGSERSRNAILDTSAGRTLVVGPALTPLLAYVDPAASRGLPRSILMQGIFEALARTVGPYLGSPGRSANQDQLVETVAARLAKLGADALGLSAPEGPTGDGLRGEVVRLGGLSHTATLHAGREAFAYKAWFLATELSWSSGSTKNSALARVLPTIWDHVANEQPRCWGDGSRLARIWGEIRAAYPMKLSADPGKGLEEFIAQWQLPRAELSAESVEGLVDRMWLRWGGNPGFLRGLSPADVRAVLLAAAVERSTAENHSRTR